MICKHLLRADRQRQISPSFSWVNHRLVRHRQAPQLYDLHLDQALLVLVLAMKRARRSPRLRAHRRPDYHEQQLPF